MKRVICVLLVLALCAVVMAPASTAQAAAFSDVPAAYWAAGEINALAARNVVAGTSAGKFSPDGRVTRE